MRCRSVPWAVALVLVVASTAMAGTAFDQTQAAFDRVLKRFVKAARVDYAGLKANPADLEHYLSGVAAVPEGQFKQWPAKQQIAFLINAYNAYTLKLIIDHYPIRSIKDIGHFWRGPWDRPMVHLFGRTMTLNTIEQGMLRRDYAEPRIHFALVCASIGCPPLRNEPYVADRLEAQLDDQARQFLADRSKNRVDPADHIVYLSPIFKWYGEDFRKRARGVLQFLQPYWPADERAGLATGKFDIRYTEYNWSLNEQGQ